MFWSQNSKNRTVHNVINYTASIEWNFSNKLPYSLRLEYRKQHPHIEWLYIMINEFAMYHSNPLVSYVTQKCKLRNKRKRLTELWITSQWMPKSLIEFIWKILNIIELKLSENIAYLSWIIRFKFEDCIFQF